MSPAKSTMFNYARPSDNGDGGGGLFVAAVAERLIAGRLAGAKELAAILFSRPFDRREIGALVGAVAERLVR